MPTEPNTVSQQPEVASRLFKAFPQSLIDDVHAVLGIVPVSRFPPTCDIGPIRIQGEDLHIPYRIHSPEPDERQANTLLGTQRTIFACLYTRHGSGFVREKYVEELIHVNTAWVPPFVLQLVGENVVKITQIGADQINILQKDFYVKIEAQNR